MNFVEFETPQKLRGGFYTDPDIAAFLTRWVLVNKPKSVLEPSCGDGVFIHALLTAGRDSVRRVLAYEIDAREAAKARDRARDTATISVKVQTGDFLKWFLLHS